MNQAKSDQYTSWPYRRYKEFRNPLERAAAAWIKSRGYNAREKYDYILADYDEWHKNIILGGVANYIENIRKQRASENKGFALHRDIHNGLSSQAMLFNLLGPLVVRDDLSALSPAFEKHNILFPTNIAKCDFEFEDRNVFNERQSQPTSFDFAINGTDDSPPIFIESKYVEQEFGRCSVYRDGDCDGRNPANDPKTCYLHSIGRTYWNLLKDYSFLQGEFLASPICLLANNYQFFREAAFAISKNGYFVLLYDERSPVFINDGPYGKRGLWHFLSTFIPENFKQKCTAITLQEIFSAICNSERHVDWTNEFAIKYGLQPASV